VLSALCLQWHVTGWPLPLLYLCSLVQVWVSAATWNTGHTQKNGAVSIGITIESAPFFCVCPVQCSCLRCLQCVLHISQSTFAGFEVITATLLKLPVVSVVVANSPSDTTSHAKNTWFFKINLSIWLFLDTYLTQSWANGRHLCDALHIFTSLIMNRCRQIMWHLYENKPYCLFDNVFVLDCIFFLLYCKILLVLYEMKIKHPVSLKTRL
jgi:hypothetical protein